MINAMVPYNSLGWGRCWLAHFVKEVLCQLVLTSLKIILGHPSASLDWNVKAIAVALEEMYCHHVSNTGRVIPGPKSQETRLVNRLISHEIVEQRIEILIGEAAHSTPQSAHLQLRLVVHLTKELLPVLQLHLEFGLLLPCEIWSLLLEVRVLVCLLSDGGCVA